MRYTRTERTNAEPFDLSAVKAYLRVDHNDEDTTIQAIANTAASEIEDFCEIALLAQTIVAVQDGWPALVLDLPCGPLIDGEPVSVEVLETDGTLTPITTGWRVEGGRYPRLHFTAPHGLAVQVTYRAGYGASRGDIPPALSHAINDLCLRMFTRRGDEDLKPGFSATAARLLARFRRVRL